MAIYWRLQALVLVFCFSAALIIGKLFYWQILQGDRLSALASSQYFTEEEIMAPRGLILTSDNYPLVQNTQAYLVYGFLKDIKNTSFEIAAVFEKILGLDKNLIKEKLDNKDVSWVSLARKIDRFQKAEIEKNNFSGIGFEEELKREYPEGSMAAQLLGFVGKDSIGRDKGYFGLEGFYNRELTGRAGILKMEKDASGRPILIGTKSQEEEISGRNLKLFLDRQIQFITENKLKEALVKYGAKSGTVVIMDPETGGIIAMASYPSYDPDKFWQYPSVFYPNPVVTESFEPGSIFKILMMAAAINEQAVKTDERCDQCDGQRVIGEYSIKTWNNKYHPNLTMSEIILYSDNVGMVYVADKLGKEKELAYIKNFGFGDLTGIDLEEEASPPLRKDEDWAPIDLATASFGQAIAVTPLQMVTAVGAIANGGSLLVPRVVNQIMTKDKNVMTQVKTKRQVIKESTARVMTEMMVNAVEKGEAAGFKIPGYRVAGKTGTAQIPIAGHYDEKKTIASFVGFAPADKPRFVMLVTLREPSSSQWGSRTAAPLWFDIAKDIFLLWKIPPS